MESVAVEALFSRRRMSGDDEPSSGSGDEANVTDGHNNKRIPVPPSGSGPTRKRSRKACGDAIVEAMLEIAAASKMRAAALTKNGDRFSISKCIKALDDLQGVDQPTYFLALDLFENPNSSTSCVDFDIELDEMELIAAAAGYLYYHSRVNQPQSNSTPTICTYLKDLLEGPAEDCREVLRMDRHLEDGIHDWLFAADAAPVVEEPHGQEEGEEVELLHLNSTPMEQAADSLRDSIACTMWDDFMNKWEEW
ncbi:unnamed protein product [Thlaspi arvense]|uniref:Uncharacterized protein n=1 Tax=Thlaspi arvense TaxID=13288 RepID=A0AAU9SY32_THLAR|nr:unnamed protein product [Thlaspi arvense]